MVDIRSKGTQYNAAWQACVGSERLAMALRAGYQNDLRRVRKELGFRALRCHGLFCDDIGVFRADQSQGARRVFHNFTNIDRIFDFLVDADVAPFLELGFMPEALASGQETVFFWKGNVTPPRSHAEWGEMVTALLEHCVARYGKTRVRSWPIEVWNEPNLTSFWKDANQSAYFELYEASVKAIKNVDAELRVGGPAICGGADHWLGDFLTFVRKRNLPVDFITRHLYSGKTPVSRSPEFLYQGLRSPQEMLDELASVRELLDAAGASNLELHITEFNTSYNPLCPVHDTNHNAAWLARVLSESGDYAKTMSFWTFSDEFEECDVPRAFFHGGFGLLAFESIPKPTYHLFRYFSLLGSEYIMRNEGCIVTRHGEGVRAVAWNPCTDGSSRAFSLDLLVPEGEYVLAESSLREDHGNPRAAWLEMGRPRWPSRDQLRIIEAASSPQQICSRLASRDGSISLTRNLGPNEVRFFELERRRDESHSYLGLDESLVYGERWPGTS